jgi:hypothetical protein
VTDVLVHVSTVEPLITHTSRWTAESMGYEGLWIVRGVLKIDSKNHKKIIGWIPSKLCYSDDYVAYLEP